MTKKTVKSLLMTAAVSGLMTGGAVTLNAQTAPSSSQTSVRSSSVASLLQADDKTSTPVKARTTVKARAAARRRQRLQGQELLQGQGRLRHRRLQDRQRSSNPVHQIRGRRVNRLRPFSSFRQAWPRILQCLQIASMDLPNTE